MSRKRSKQKKVQRKHWRRLPRDVAFALREKPQIWRMWRKLQRTSRLKLIQMTIERDEFTDRHQKVDLLMKLVTETYKKVHGIS